MGRFWLLGCLVFGVGCGAPVAGDDCDSTALVCTDDGDGPKCLNGKWSMVCDRCTEDDEGAHCPIKICIADSPDLCP